MIICLTVFFFNFHKITIVEIVYDCYSATLYGIERNIGSLNIYSIILIYKYTYYNKAYSKATYLQITNIDHYV